ncbi:MAG: hypothetical protein Q9225_002027 [Loekoesia sp. 1 TL-2023]
MPKFCHAWLALFLTLLGKAVASTNHRRDFCNNQTVNIHSTCWDDLGISQYLDRWWIENEADCSSEPYKADGFAVQDCYHPNFNENTNVNITEYYVLYSIYGIWAWYNSLWQAAVASTLLADLSAGEIVDAIKSDMPKDTPLPGDTSLGVLLSLLSAGLAFVDFPAGGASSRVFSTAAQQAPGLAKALLTTGSLGSQVTPLDEIEAYLGSIMQQFQLNLANALNVTQMDYNIFITHAANGSFIANTPSLNASTAGLTRNLKTFIVSQALQSHNIIVTVAEKFDIYSLSHRKFTQPENGTMLPQNSWHVNCQDMPDEHGVCDDWWVDSTTNDSYALFKLDDMEHNFYGLMQTIFGKGWTTGKELFLGSRLVVQEPIYYPDRGDSIYYQNVRAGVGIAYVTLMTDGGGLDPSGSINQSWVPFPISRITESNGQYYGPYAAGHGVLASNSLYDICNTPVDALQAQANRMDPKLCKQYPTDGSNPGWGGAGYHVHDEGCRRYPASYLGPGLYWNTELCGPLP